VALIIQTIKPGGKNKLIKASPDLIIRACFKINEVIFNYMSDFKANIDKSIVRFSNFAKALALPIRVWTIKMILDNGNLATRAMLYQIPFNDVTINQHLNELKYLGIIKTMRKDRVTFFSVNEDVFIQMSNNFLKLFESLGQLNEQAKSIIERPRLKKKTVILDVLPIERFGKYLREKRSAKGLSQDSFSAGLKISRSHLSRIECSKTPLGPLKLKKIAELLEIPLHEVINIYYQDKIIEFNNENEAI
jgi:DNA-binding transcriptional ArsR family regulator